MPRLRRLPVNVPTRYEIIDGGIWPQDKEYIELGEREGWLTLYRIERDPYTGESVYQYRYPDTYKCE